MSSVCLVFTVHIPYILKNYSFFEIGENPFYANEEANEEQVLNIAKNCYLPANKIIAENIKKYKKAFKVSFAISGTTLDLLEEHAPEVIESFQTLAETGCVDFLAEPHAHGFSFLYSKAELKEQVAKHGRRIKKLFNVIPKVLRAPELMYNNELANWAEEAGYKGIIADGSALYEQNPNFVYTPATCEKIKLLCRNNGLSDDIALRFSDRSWAHYPLYADTYAQWVSQSAKDAQVVNIFTKYEHFGMHHNEESGIFNFLQALPAQILKDKYIRFVTIREAANFPTQKNADTHFMSAWVEPSKNLSSYYDNDLQSDVMATVFGLEEMVKQSKSRSLLDMWRILQSSEYIMAMAIDSVPTREESFYSIQAQNPYDIYINMMNILADVKLRAQAVVQKKKKKAE